MSRKEKGGTMNKLMRHIGLIGLMGLIWLIGLKGFTSCTPEPPLHLYDAPELAVALNVSTSVSTGTSAGTGSGLDMFGYWETVAELNERLNVDAQWYYGWDENDIKTHHSPIGYTLPSTFNIRCYYTGEVPNAPHTGVVSGTIIVNERFIYKFEYGYWDMLLWNQIVPREAGIQSIIIDETSSLDSVIAYTNQTMHTSRYNAPKYTRSFNEPELLFSFYDPAIEVNEALDAFKYDKETDTYVRTLELRPLTYIYLTQVILHNNKGRIASVDGNANLSGMARSTNLNTGVAGTDAITVYFNVMKKDNLNMKGELVDIIGGRLQTFGIPGNVPKKPNRSAEVKDTHRHYMDITMQFNNGMDSTFVFDVTDTIRKYPHGGIITYELDMDTVPIPKRSGGSGFDAVVKDFEDGGTHEFEM